MSTLSWLCASLSLSSVGACLPVAGVSSSHMTSPSRRACAHVSGAATLLQQALDMRGHANGKPNNSDFATVSDVNRKANLGCTALATTQAICLVTRAVTLDLLKGAAPSSGQATQATRPAVKRQFTKERHAQVFNTKKGAAQRRRCTALPTRVRLPAARACARA